MFALVSLKHTLLANLVLRRCDRFGQRQGHTQSHNLAESFQSTLVSKKAPGKNLNQLVKRFSLPFESKESSRKVNSEVDQISAGVSLRESDSGNLNLENNSLISFK